MGRAEISHGGTSESGTRSIAAVCIVSLFTAPQDEFVWLADSPPIQSAEDSIL